MTRLWSPAIPSHGAFVRWENHRTKSNIFQPFFGDTGIFCTFSKVGDIFCVDPSSLIPQVCKCSWYLINLLLDGPKCCCGSASTIFPWLGSMSMQAMWKDNLTRLYWTLQVLKKKLSVPKLSDHRAHINPHVWWLNHWLFHHDLHRNFQAQRIMSILEDAGQGACPVRPCCLSVSPPTGKHQHMAHIYIYRFIWVYEGSHTSFIHGSRWVYSFVHTYIHTYINT